MPAVETFNYADYFAQISVQHIGNGIVYESTRHNGGAHFAASYQPTGQPYRSAPGSIDHWFSERYCLYAADNKGRLYRGDIHHLPWPLQAAAAEQCL